MRGSAEKGKKGGEKEYGGKISLKQSNSSSIIDHHSVDPADDDHSALSILCEHVFMLFRCPNLIVVFLDSLEAVHATVLIHSLFLQIPPWREVLRCEENTILTPSQC